MKIPKLKISSLKPILKMVDTILGTATEIYNKRKPKVKIQNIIPKLKIT